jgi:putative NIF3 family GTP cyclohydrolase 1 type 2
MQLRKIVSQLDEEFNIDEFNEDWHLFFDSLFLKKSVASFRNPNKNTGLMIANSNEVNKIYTAFSPSRFILEEIRLRGIVNVLLVVKHPFDWDGRRNGPGFISFKERDYQLMESMGISIYSLHAPLDKNRNDKVVSTAYGFAKVIKLKVEEEFGNDEDNSDINIGLIGRINERKIDDLTKRLNKLLDYRVKLRKVNEEVGKVAILTGGGFIPEIIQQAKERGVNTYITGVISPNASRYDKNNYKERLSKIKRLGLNIIGCSHYLTEKWAMVYSIPYFSDICKSEFLEDREALNLLE